MIKSYRNFLSVNEYYEYDDNGECTTITIYQDDPNSVDRSDIDPYGEEEWEEDKRKLDWNKIKIVHPRYWDTENEGKRVLIVPDSCYYTMNQNNPMDVFGTISRITGLDHCFNVRWDNGGENGYRPADLTLIKIDKRRRKEVPASKLGSVRY